jgi:uncharacterized LabA/DUF88 family protein
LYRTAILVDAGFFLKRYSHICPGIDHSDPQLAADTLYDLASRHLNRPVRGATGTTYERDCDLYRLFVYDSPPLEKRIHSPIAKRAINLAASPEAQFRNAFHRALLRKRKVALRLGRLAEKTGTWRLKQEALRRLIDEVGQPVVLSDDDFALDVGQKGVDMRIGLDISAISFKKQVDRVVLIAGDADFVPAAKLARREGVDFILDPLWLKVSDDLLEHIDGLRSTSPNPNRPTPDQS